MLKLVRDDTRGKRAGMLRGCTKTILCSSCTTVGTILDTCVKIQTTRCTWESILESTERWNTERAMPDTCDTIQTSSDTIHGTQNTWNPIPAIPSTCDRVHASPTLDTQGHGFVGRENERLLAR